jgi:dynein heavy chain
MGVKYAEGVILNIEEMWKESNVRVPMVCFLSMGSDPTNDIDQLSRKHNLSEKN